MLPCVCTVNRWSQMTSKWGKNKKVALHAMIAENASEVITTFCRLLLNRRRAVSNLLFHIIKKKANGVIYASSLQQIIIKNQSKCENKLTYYRKVNSSLHTRTAYVLSHYNTSMCSSALLNLLGESKKQLHGVNCVIPSVMENVLIKRNCQVTQQALETEDCCSAGQQC